VAFWRLADAHTPITDVACAGSAGFEPSRVRWVFGTWTAIVWTLKARSASTPGAAGVGMRCRFWKGRRSSRSKIDPRST
jgi:hypothetical protein